MYKAALISLGSQSSKLTHEAMKKYFEKVDHINLKFIEVSVKQEGIKILYKGKPLPDYDCILAKGSFRYAAVLRSITAARKKSSYMPILPSSFTIVNDKLLTHLKLQEHGVPMPTTYIASTIEGAKEILEKVNYPIVMKFPQGTHGKGVMFSESKSSAASMLDALTVLNQSFIIQEYIETDGTDLRAFVIGNKVVAAMQRSAAPGEERANLHSGGSGDPIVLEDYTKKIAIKAAQSLGCDICAVDILEGIKGPLVLEVNYSPGLGGIMDVTKIDVADKIAKYLLDKTDEIKSKEKKGEASKIMDSLDVGKGQKEIITNLKFRGERILLPEVVTKVTRFNEKDEVAIKVDEKRLVIKKFEIGNGL
ncbi:RimK family alpha-L-glutamate ligase [Nanoarchaeota archaeon]